jgi:hypothetical protein
LHIIILEEGGMDLAQKEAIIAQIVGAHQRWYNKRNRDRKVSREEITDWIKKLYASGFEEGQLLLLLNDEKSRNQLLGIPWTR